MPAMQTCTTGYRNGMHMLSMLPLLPLQQAVGLPGLTPQSRWRPGSASWRWPAQLHNEMFSICALLQLGSS